jgi:lipoate-protein ligase A
MAIDDAILGAVAKGASLPTLRLYGWSPPAVSLGRFQINDEGIDLSVCRQRGWDVVRRPTGGRAVLHAEELTYSLAVPLELIGNIGVRTSHCLFTRALHQALREMIPAEAPTSGAASPRDARSASCFALATTADSLVAGRKLVGSAQVRRDGALLQHGSILLHVDREALTELFAAPGDPIGLDELVPELPPWRDLQLRIAQGFVCALGIRLAPGILSDEEAACCV